jgi:hypothetical protein
VKKPNTRYDRFTDELYMNDLLHVTRKAAYAVKDTYDVTAHKSSIILRVSVTVTVTLITVMTLDYDETSE